MVLKCPLLFALISKLCLRLGWFHNFFIEINFFSLSLLDELYESTAVAVLELIFQELLIVSTKCNCLIDVLDPAIRHSLAFRCEKNFRIVPIHNFEIEEPRLEKEAFFGDRAHLDDI